MTVSELIQQLQNLPQDLQLWVSAKDDKSATAIKVIKVVDTDEFVKPFVHIITSDRL